MSNKFSFYLQKNNKMFDGSLLTICYKADKKEIEKYGLTSENIVLFLKSKKLDNIIDKQDYDYFKNCEKLLDKNLILRIQCECFLGMYGDSHCDCEEQRQKAINIIKKEGGILLHLPQEAQGWGLFYKLKELELQVSGRKENGEYIGKKNRDEAQKILINLHKFRDNRSYEIIDIIFKQLKIRDKNIVLITDSSSKIESMRNMGYKVEKYDDYKEKNIDKDNVSEYLIKVLNNTHNFDDKTIYKMIDVIAERKYNERTLSIFIELIDKIKNEKQYSLPKKYKDAFLELYSEIICGEEKRYIIGDENHIKVQNNFSCRVDSSIFKILTMIYGKGIFDRISLEKIYYFKGKKDDTSVRFRTSKLLDSVEDKCPMFKGQMHVNQSIYDYVNKKVVQKEVSTSTLRSYFENPEYEYVKRIEMITIISENILDKLNIFIKRVPKSDSRIIDIFGDSNNIRELIEKIVSLNSSTLLSSINDNDLSEQNFSEHNLRFADLNSIIEEEMNMYQLTKEEDNDNGIRG